MSEETRKALRKSADRCVVVAALALFAISIFGGLVSALYSWTCFAIYVTLAGLFLAFDNLRASFQNAATADHNREWREEC